MIWRISETIRPRFSRSAFARSDIKLSPIAGKAAGDGFARAREITRGA
jgi:hypothetical protein